MRRSELSDDGFFASAKSRFPFDFEDDSDLHSGAKFDLTIGVNKTFIEALGEMSTDGGFAGTHKTY